LQRLAVGHQGTIEKLSQMSIIAVEMKNVAVANGLTLGQYSRQELPGGGHTLARVLDFARRLPGVEQPAVLLAGQAACPDGFQPVRLQDGSAAELLAALARLADGSDNLFYFFADCPLLDARLAARMLDSHRRYFADYTFADGYPLGLAVEILRPQALPALVALAAGCPEVQADARGAIFEVLRRDINSFDVETELAPIDLRQLRLVLSADTKRNLLLLRRLLVAGAADAEGACRLVQERPELLRTLPAFFAIQIVEGCPQLCSYCPYPKFGIRQTGKQAQMPLERFLGLADRIRDFCAEAVLDVSLWGEPAYYEGFPELAAAVRDRGLRLVVETSGVGWQGKSLEQVPAGDYIDWIVSLDADGPQLYRTLRGEGYEEAVRSLETLAARFPGRVHAQAVRMKENEEPLEEFYRGWKAKMGKVIIQKYDHFCGLLPDRRVADLSPLKRFPCWHLKRDLAVLIDGRVPLCREDVGRAHPLGNLFEEDLAAVWGRAEVFYRAHLREEYLQLCAACDEYYTFNF
jgi:spiro-SPASM protein